MKCHTTTAAVLIVFASVVVAVAAEDYLSPELRAEVEL